jgi:hypothetical protein
MVWSIRNLLVCISTWRLTKKEKIILERIKNDLEELTKEELEHLYNHIMNIRENS